MASNDCKPLIGITSYLRRARFGVWDTEAAVLQRSYLDAVTNAGGIPVLLPPAGEDCARIAAAVDGLILAGGADIAAASYRRQPHSSAGTPSPERDTFEFAMVREALSVGLPVLGVCRGLEVLNVALGGSLTQHQPDVTGNLNHQPGAGVFGTITVRTLPGSRAAAILGRETTASCYHHQAIESLAAGLAATAWAEDGTIEAVELPGEGFVLGVQWHPEEDRKDIRLFSALVDAARTREELSGE